MKKAFLFLMSFALFWQSGMGTTTIAPSPDFISEHITERGQNHQLVQTVIATTNTIGQISFQTNSYVALANGMNYRDSSGRWAKSEAKIDIGTEGNGIANRGGHKVAFAANIHTPGAIDLMTPDNKRLRSHVLGLAYHDFKKDQSILIAEVKDSVGILVGDNQVVYQDAFTDFEADIRYTYTIDGLEQDIILRERPPLPEKFGFDPRTTWLEVWTEFINPPNPKIDRRIRKGWEKSKVDKVLDFGAMQIAEGSAFGMGGNANRHQGIPVQKHWETIDGRTFLIEEVSFRWSIPQLRTLPEKRQAAIPKNDKIRQASNQRLFPESPQIKRKSDARIEVAKLVASDPGFVLDYAILSTTNDFTFKGDTTYYVGGTVNLSGATTIEGGAVIKFNSGTTINVLGTIECLTEPYRPAVLTSYRDNTVGQTVATGTPSGTYASVALSLANGGFLHNLHFRYATKGIFSDQNYTISDSQFIHCGTAIQTEWATFSARNILMYDVGTGFFGRFYHGTAEHLTFDEGNLVTDDWDFYSGVECSSPPSSQISLVNSIVTSVDSYGIVPIYGDHVTTLASSAGVYQSVGGGAHYLTSNSSNRNVGTTNISADLLADLKKKTTYPPIPYSNTNLLVNTTWITQAKRDTDIPDLGYHYAPLDYLINKVTNSAALIINQDVAVGVYTTSYDDGAMSLKYPGSLNSQGEPLHHNLFAGYATVQENGIAGSAANAGSTLRYEPVEGELGYLGVDLSCRFTDFSLLSGGSTWSHIGQFDFDFGTYLSASAGNWKFQDCRFDGASAIFALELGGNTTFTLGMTNCLFERSKVGFGGGSTVAHNNLFYGGTVYIWDQWSEDQWQQYPYSLTLRDNLFYQSAISQSLSFGTLTHDHNGYVTNFDRLSPNGTGDVIVPTNFVFQTNWFGRYYQSTNSPLIGSGSTNANLLRLYQYTTTTNQVKETNSIVDIGFHYVAPDSLDLPADTDSDGIPDYLEDSNGDGVYDSNDGLGDADGDGVIDREDASPFNAGIGRLQIRIDVPINGSTIN